MLKVSLCSDESALDNRSVRISLINLVIQCCSKSVDVLTARQSTSVILYLLCQTLDAVQAVWFLVLRDELRLLVHRAMKALLVEPERLTITVELLFDDFQMAKDYFTQSCGTTQNSSHTRNLKLCRSIMLQLLWSRPIPFCLSLYWSLPHRASAWCLLIDLKRERQRARCIYMMKWTAAIV